VARSALLAPNGVRLIEVRVGRAHVFFRDHERRSVWPRQAWCSHQARPMP